jgi:hypothetical protein
MVQLGKPTTTRTGRGRAQRAAGVNDGGFLADQGRCCEDDARDECS